MIKPAMKTAISLSQIYSVSDVTRLLNCDRQQVTRMIKKGNLRATRLGVRVLAISGYSIYEMLSSDKHPLSRYRDLLFKFVQ